MKPATLLLVIAIALAPVAAAQDSEPIARTTIKMWIPAVGQSDDGSLFGVASSMEVTGQTPGTGQVFLSTQPLTQIDMQGSARLAVDTASAITGRDASKMDFFFSVRTPSVTIGGPSAGAAMAVAVAALLQGIPVDQTVVMTGMINPDGSIGPIGGVLQKLEAAASVGAERFLVPLGQSTVVVTVREQDPRTGATVERQRVVDVREVGRSEYGIDVEEVADLYDAIAPFTGFRLVRPQPTTDPVQGQTYGGITSRLAQNLTSLVAQRLSDIDARFDAPAVRNRAEAAEEQVIQSQIDLAANRLVSAQNAQNDSKQYLASSLAFQGLVALDYAEALIAFFESSSTIAQYTAQYLAETESVLLAVQRDITITYPIAASQLDSQAGAEQRLLDARDLQAQARVDAQARNYGSALQASSFARERAESARWWWSIGMDVAATAPFPSVSQQMVEALWTKYRETVELELAYAALIASQQPQLAEAQTSSTRSVAAAREGLWAAGVLELVESLAQTSTALVALAGVEPVRQRLADLSDSAAFQIELAQAQGSPPVYAIALLELATSRAAEDPVAAYAGYSTARLSARATLQVAGIVPPQAVLEEAPQRSRAHIDDVIAPEVLAYGALAGLSAILLLIIWGVNNRTAPPVASSLPPPPPQPEPPQPPPFPPVEPAVGPWSPEATPSDAALPEAVPPSKPRPPRKRRAPAKKASPTRRRRKPPGPE